ncbi:hypothetical protein [Trichococcus shcherbakoviae]|uniref:hypothetical protein n=1 Tax=Trichococcus shcherbakoviae TaxID=2094020 RepID=UPI002AA81BEA|nr:hypothetical protein [Trichococcus shcherbakoviae]
MRPPISEEIVDAVHADLQKNSLSQREIAKKYAVSRGFVAMVAKNKRKLKNSPDDRPLRGPRRVPQHECLQCRRLIVYEPCQICIALAARAKNNPTCAADED